MVLTEGWGNPPETTTNVLGMVFPAGRTFADDTWGAVVTWDASGYVSDSDAASMDHDSLLTTLRGDEAAINAARAGRAGIAGGPPLWNRRRLIQRVDALPNQNSHHRRRHALAHRPALESHDLEQAVGRGAGDDQLRPVLLRQALHGVVVDDLVGVGHRVGEDTRADLPSGRQDLAGDQQVRDIDARDEKQQTRSGGERQHCRPHIAGRPRRVR